VCHGRLAAAGSNGLSGRHERETIEPGDTGADIKLRRDELILEVTALLELASGATLLEGCDQVLAMAFKERDRGVSLW
jgi:hypothetical protein